MFSRYALLALALTTVAPLVSAHGSMSGVFIDDVYYPGPPPNTGNQVQSTIREVNSINPVKGTDNPDLFCGHNAPPAALVAEANQGSVVKFAWVNGESGPWVHNTGPVLTYMASCGDGGCTSFNDRNAQWFKISELGRHEDGSWFMSDMTTGFNATTQATIPTFLPDGEYLVRHELVAMHNGLSEGGVEFYPACVQVRLTGGVTSQKLPDTNTVTFPGAYNPTDPGVLDPNIYNPGSEYIFPGPPVVSATDPTTPEDPSEDPAPSDAPANTSSSPSTTSESAAPEPTSGCGYTGQKKKKRTVKRVIKRGSLVKKSHLTGKRAAEQIQPLVKDWKRAAEQHQPVVRSRVMRGI